MSPKLEYTIGLNVNVMDRILQEKTDAEEETMPFSQSFAPKPIAICHLSPPHLSYNSPDQP